MLWVCCWWCSSSFFCLKILVSFDPSLLTLTCRVSVCRCPSWSSSVEFCWLTTFTFVSVYYLSLAEGIRLKCDVFAVIQLWFLLVVLYFYMYLAFLASFLLLLVPTYENFCNVVVTPCFYIESFDGSRLLVESWVAIIHSPEWFRYYMWSDDYQGLRRLSWFVVLYFGLFAFCS